MQDFISKISAKNVFKSLKPVQFLKAPPSDPRFGALSPNPHQGLCPWTPLGHPWLPPRLSSSPGLSGSRRNTGCVRVTSLSIRRLLRQCLSSPRRYIKISVTEDLVKQFVLSFVPTTALKTPQNQHHRVHSATHRLTKPGIRFWLIAELVKRIGYT